MSTIKSLLAGLVGQIKLEPVFVSGLLLSALTIVDAQLNEGVSLETALVAAFLTVGSRLVRNFTYPAVKVDAATGAAIEPLEAPITGLDD